jgi:hypothetical protein
MDETEQPQMGSYQDAIDRYLAGNPSLPDLPGKEWFYGGPWGTPLKITYNGVDITEQAKGATPRLYEFAKLMHMTRPAPQRSLDVEISFGLTRDEYNFLMRWSGARRRIWTSRKFRRPGGRVASRSA